MHIEPVIHSNELPALFNRLFGMAPYELWKKRVRELDIRLKHNPFLERYLSSRFPFERTLVDIAAYRRDRGHYPDVEGPRGSRFYDVYSLIGTLVRVDQRLSEQARARLRGRLKAGLGHEDGLLPLALEMTTAVHLWGAGFDIEFTDLNGTAQFDFLARTDEIEVEIDCKTALGDGGRKIPERHAFDCLNRIRPQMMSLLEKPGGHGIRISLPAGLTGNVEILKALTSLVEQSIENSCSPAASSLGSVSITPFDLPPGSFNQHGTPSAEEVSNLAEQIFHRRNINAVSIHRPGTSAVVATVLSDLPDDPMDSAYETMKDSAERQLSGVRPGLLAIRFIGLTSSSLQRLAQDANHGLAAISDRLFKNPKRHHLYGVAFVASSGVPTRVASLPGDTRTTLRDSGASLIYRRPGHPMENDRRLLRMFSGNA